MIHFRGSRSKLAICSAALILGLLLVEGAFRCALFADKDWLGLQSKLRNSSLYAPTRSDDDFWKLFLQVERIQPPLPAERYHPLLGWVPEDVDQHTLDHRARGRICGRTPILLYGDSFARCISPPSLCFEGLMHASDLNSRYLVINYGAGGYGLDQIYLLFHESIGQWTGLNPVIVIALQLDEALDRCVLHIRGWPKPRLVLVGEELVPDEFPVPSIEALCERNPISIHSYAWRYLLHQTHLVPVSLRERWTNAAQIEQEKQALCTLILGALVREVRERGCECFFLLFNDERTTFGRPEPDWRQECLTDFLRAHDVPWVSTTTAIRAHAREHGLGARAYFSRSGEDAGHYLPLGNELAFSALRAGLERRFEHVEAVPAPAAVR